MPKFTVPFIFFSSLLLNWFCLGWEGLGSGLPPAPSCDVWSCSAFPICCLGFLNGRVLGVVVLLILKTLYNCLPRPTCGTRYNVFKSHSKWRVWNGRCSCQSLWGKMVMVTGFGSVLPPSPSPACSGIPSICLSYVLRS